ncbi:hypothetical protein ESCO_004860 [Escovopsis weberi]|uniref:Uncharacterized protein n=1 Tax=Escovopsis weberi TaxID=150374 RepID=A0A0M9VRJ5_ESCWE|nr:hypothetical protein ESCO_004860 [Escovopsis weberi]
MPFLWPGADADSVPANASPSSIYRSVPSMQAYRNNLTALSQVHNALSREPEVKLYTGRSKVSLDIGGCVDRANPHTINHLITGMLGGEEIVVAAFDDGDVVAYLVRDVVDYVFGNSSRPMCITSRHKKARVRSPPKAFFHENVGRSAWGLAVHAKSRLLAVSSNRCEVTVFAFSLTSCRGSGGQQVSESCDCCPRCQAAASGIPRRERNWRILIVFTSEASNIPNISFLDSRNGQAEMICAVDILGALWFAPIWKAFQSVTRIGPSQEKAFRSEESWPNTSR